jgi:O-antigen/teichoic acid export membrane protein
MDSKAILKDGLMLSGRRFWAVGFGVAFTYMSASLLGPKGFGLLALLRLIPALAVILGIGWVDASCREILHLRGGGSETVARQVRDVAYTAEAGVSLLWLLVILGYSVSVSDWVVRVGLWIAGISLVLTLLIRLMSNDIAIGKDFRLKARVGFLTATLNFGFGLVAAWLWGALGLFAALTLVQLVEAVIYQRAMKFSFRLTWDKRVLVRLTRIGLPLALLTFFGSAIGVNLWIERGIIGSQGGLEVLGVFVFSVSVVRQMEILIGEVMVSYKSHFWERLGKHPAATEIFALVRKPSLVLAFMAAILGVLVLAILPPLIFTFLAKYRSMLGALWIFVAGGLVGTLYYIPSIFLRSTYANRQTYLMFSQMAGSLLYAAMLWLMIAKLQLGIPGTAWAILFLQITMCIFSLAKAYPYYIESFREGFRFLGEQLLPMALVGGVYGLCHWAVMDSGYLRSKNELTNMLMVSVPMAMISLTVLIIWMERKTSVLNHLYRLIKERNLVPQVFSPR